MDWNFAIEKHREALKVILAMLVAMAGFSVSHVGGAAVAGGAPTLPRRLHRALLALLRPAEAAARRLVIMAARGLVVEVKPTRPRKPAPPSILLRKGERGTGIVLPPGFEPPPGFLKPARSKPRPPRPGFRLFDPLPRWQRRVRRPAVPRLSVPGFGAPFPIAIRNPLSLDDPIDAARVVLRLSVLTAALDDLPRQAKRFARWRTRRAAFLAFQARGGSPSHRHRRLEPLRPGLPPGHRPKRSRRAFHQVDEVLRDVHGLALWALSDTS